MQMSFHGHTTKLAVKVLRVPFFTDNFWYLIIFYGYCRELLILTDNLAVATDICCWY